VGGIVRFEVADDPGTVSQLETAGGGPPLPTLAAATLALIAAAGAAYRWRRYL